MAADSLVRVKNLSLLWRKNEKEEEKKPNLDRNTPGDESTYIIFH